MSGQRLKPMQCSSTATRCGWMLRATAVALAAKIANAMIEAAIVDEEKTPQL
jgi:hypothetical protein